MTANGKAFEANKEEVTVENGERTRSRRSFVPRTDIFETEDAIVLLSDMPGVTPDGVDITLEQNVLSIQGLVEPRAPEGYGLAYAEYEDGDYVRRFTLSDQIEADGIAAELKDGVLTLTLPKVKPRQKKIAVRAG